MALDGGTIEMGVLFATFVIALFGSLASAAQHEHHAPAAKGTRATASLTAEAVQQLLNGDGMGLARSAELNRYPGPKHALDLKSELKLTAEQEQRMSAVRQQMLDTARRLGREIVEAEEALDAAFGAGDLSQAQLTQHVESIARLQGQLRLAHLQAHLQTKELLTADQIRTYYDLRAPGPAARWRP